MTPIWSMPSVFTPHAVVCSVFVSLCQSVYPVTFCRCPEWLMICWLNDVAIGKVISCHVDLLCFFQTDTCPLKSSPTTQPLAIQFLHSVCTREHIHLLYLTMTKWVSSLIEESSERSWQGPWLSMLTSDGTDCPTYLVGWSLLALSFSSSLSHSPG